MKVAVVQFKPRRGAVQHNLARLGPLAARAAARARLVVLPELCHTGYVFRDRSEILPFAEPPRGALFELLAPIARDARATIVAGFVERDRDRLFNSAIVVGPAGDLVWVYRKTLLFEADLAWATPGDSGYRILPIEDRTFAVGICMDLNDDAFTAWLRQARPPLLAFPTNWVDQGRVIWPYWQERIADTGTTLLAADTYGLERRVPFHGRSAILNEHRVFTALAPSGDGVAVAEIAP